MTDKTEKQQKDRQSQKDGVDGLSSQDGCSHCIDPEGECCYPYYGLRPHDHDLTKTGSFIGSTVIRDEPLPDNFIPAPECPNEGTYTHCEKCGFHG